MIKNEKVYPPYISYCAKVIPLAFNESMSYYECICNITNHINNIIIPAVNESNTLVHENDIIVKENNEIVKEVNEKYVELKNYVDNNMLTVDTQDLEYYTLTSNLSSVALSGDYDDLTNKPTIPDVTNFITKDVNDLTYYTLTSNLSSVATSGDYDDLLNKPTIPTVPTNVSAFNNDSGYITKSVDDLTNYTLTTALTSLLGDKENVIEKGSNTNGYYIKFSDGTLIQYGSYENSSLSCSTSYGSYYYGTTANINFPKTFTNVYTIVPILKSNGIGSCCINNITTSSFTCRVINGTNASINMAIYYIAIGN